MYTGNSGCKRLRKQQVTSKSTGNEREGGRGQPAWGCHQGHKVKPGGSTPVSSPAPCHLGIQSPTQESKLIGFPSRAPSLVQALRLCVVFSTPHGAEDTEESRGLCSCTEGAGALYKSKEETTRGQTKGSSGLQGRICTTRTKT